MIFLFCMEMESTILCKVRDVDEINKVSEVCGISFDETAVPGCFAFTISCHSLIS